MACKTSIPRSRRCAGIVVRRALAKSLAEIGSAEFITAWYAVAYLNPGLHPDGYDSPDSGWTPTLRRFAAEAWRRAERGELSDGELYPSDAAWAGLCDRLKHPGDEDRERRRLLVGN